MATSKVSNMYMSIFGEFKYLRALDKRRVKIQEDLVEYANLLFYLFLFIFKCRVIRKIADK